MKNSTRESHFEALRIVAMMCVILHHTMLLGPYYMGYSDGHPYSWQEQGFWPVLINAITVPSVNMFVLITGWYGLRHVLRAVIRILVDVAAFGMVSYVLCSWIMGFDIAWDALLRSVDIHQWWYPYTYLLLILVAPFLEMAMKRYERETEKSWMTRFWLLIVALGLVDFLLGWKLHLTPMDGYKVYTFHFFFLYALARMIRVRAEQGLYLRKRWWALMYVASVLLITSGFLYEYAYLGRVTTPVALLTGWFAHNHPLMTMVSLSLFAVFAQLHFSSKWVNTAATTVFGVYLMHTSPMGTRVVKWLATWCFNEASLIGLLACAVVVFVSFGVVTYLLNILKDRFVFAPLFHGVDYIEVVKNNFLKYK